MQQVPTFEAIGLDSTRIAGGLQSESGSLRNPYEADGLVQGRKARRWDDPIQKALVAKR